MIEEPKIKCPFCGMTSWNPNDVRWKYCGNCHNFHDRIIENEAEILQKLKELTLGEPGLDTPEARGIAAQKVLGWA